MRNAKFRARNLLAVSVTILVILGAAVGLSMSGHSESKRNGFSNSDIGLEDAVRVASSLQGQSGAEPPQSMRVASVPALISGLEQRLKVEQDDARGWSLLAQSYAFLGRADQAERALERAVALGLDEAELRQRVEGASRSPHSDPSKPELVGR